MKALLLTVLLAISTSANALEWSRLATMGNKTIKPVAQYDVDTAGFDLRVYEFTPSGNPNVRCVYANASKAAGMSCYEVTKESSRR